jgi:hypothetical protein
MVAEITSLKIATKTVLLDIAKHAQGLASGLQNAAPPQEKGPGKTVLYLTEVAKELDEKCRALDDSSTHADDDEF